MTKASVILGLILLFFAFGLKPAIRNLRMLTRTPVDSSMGQLERLSAAQLESVYGGKRTLIVGGTRGVGRGIARAIVEAGGDITLSGRSAATGAEAVAYLKTKAKTPSQRITFLAGDIGTQKSARALVKKLAEKARTEGKYDYMVVTAAVFPDWNELLNEDGLEKSQAIAVVGRYMLYRHMHLYLKDGGRLLNVLASGEKKARFERDLLTAQRTVADLFEAISNFGVGNELMQIGVQETGKFNNIIRVSTFPGILVTDLHRGQGWVFDLIETVAVALTGMSEDECGDRQASILASPRLHKGQLSYVDEDMIGRTRSTQLQELADKHLLWLMAWLNERTDRKSVV